MIESLACEVIHNALEGFKVTRKWICQFLKQYMNWTFKVETTTTSKLPNDWDQQGREMGYRVAYLVKTYNIPIAQWVKSDQNGLHLVPITKE